MCLVGATGMIGTNTIERAPRQGGVRVIGIARRGALVSPGVSVEMLTGETRQWPGLISSARADVLACALGTTRAKAGSARAFQAIDRDLVIACGQAARGAGIGRMIVVSSVGANPASRNLYLRTKGQMEEDLAQLGFVRLDILRPAQLIGRRMERRPLEHRA